MQPKCLQRVWRRFLSRLVFPTLQGAEIYDFSGERRRAHFEAVFERVLELNPAAVVATFGGLREPEADALRDARIFNIATATTLHEAKVLRAAHCDGRVVKQPGREAALKMPMTLRLASAR